MCLNVWEEINYEQIHSLITRYTKVFTTHSQAFKEYKAKLSTGEAKINVATIYPYDIINNFLYGDSELAELEWKNLGNLFTINRTIPIVDVSGSMTTEVGKQFQPWI